MRETKLILLILLFFVTTLCWSALLEVDGYYYTSIQPAIDDAVDGDTVLVHPGIYYENIVIDHKDIYFGSLFLTTNNRAYIHSTVIDGNNYGNCVIVEGIGNIDNLETHVVGFTIQNGYADEGSGVWAFSSNPEIYHNKIRFNVAWDHGAGIAAHEGGSPKIYNNLIYNNSASEWGGGIHCHRCSTKIYNNFLWGNQAGEMGGAISIDSLANPVNSTKSDSIWIINNTIVNNYAPVGGGLAIWRNSAAYVLDNIFWGNDASGNNGNQIALDGTYGSCHLIIDYNNIQGTASDIFVGSGCSIDYGPGNINIYPGFINPYSTPPDYRLPYSSPCVNNGLPSTVGWNIPSHCWDTNPRIMFGNIDIGADEVGNIDFIGDNLYVNTGADSTDSDGSYFNPYATIQSAINHAQNGQQIMLQSGIYTGDGNYEIDPLGKSLTIVGEPDSNQTIIDLSAKYNSRAFHIHSGEDSSLVISNLTIKNGYNDYGSAILIENNSSPLITDCEIYNCATDYDGGAIFISNCNSDTTRLRNISLHDNSAGGNGAAIALDNSSALIANLTISQNTTSEDGGGIYAENGSNFKVINSIIWNNYAANDIYLSGSNLNISYSDFDSLRVIESARSILYGLGNINANPQFADDSGDDYSLSADSPCIDAGCPVYSWNDPDSTRNDMGAFYYHQCNADFIADDTEVYYGDVIRFTDKSSGNPDSWQWDFNDDGTIDSHIQYPTWRCESVGTFSVSLTVSADSLGVNEETKEDYYTVYPLVVNFSASPVYGYDSLTVHFSNETEGNADEYKWDFDNDGNIDSHDEFPASYTYGPGVYDVKLEIVKGSYQDSLIKENCIVVQDSMLQPPQDVFINISGDDVILQWQPVRDSLYYLIYNSPGYNIEFEYLGYSENIAIYTHQNGALNDKMFYEIIAFEGNLSDLTRYLGFSPYHKKMIRKKPLRNSRKIMIKPRIHKSD